MMHNLKISMAKGTGKKEIIGQDASHNTTHNVLAAWKGQLHQLTSLLNFNQSSWKSLLQSYGMALTVGEAVYATTDMDARTCLQTLHVSATAVINASEQEENADVAQPRSPPQKVEASKQEISTMLSRIANAEALHAKRLEATRQWTYYDRKTKTMLTAESKGKKPVSAKDVERRTRNQKKVMDLAINLNSVTSQLYSELEYIDMERLAITDRAMSALLQLQKFFFEKNPTIDAVHKAEQIRLAQRVVPREEVRPWMPETLQPANPNPNMSNPNVMQSAAVPPVPPVPAEGGAPFQMHPSAPVPSPGAAHPPMPMAPTPSGTQVPTPPGVPTTPQPGAPVPPQPGAPVPPQPGAPVPPQPGAPVASHQMQQQQYAYPPGAYPPNGQQYQPYPPVAQPYYPASAGQPAGTAPPPPPQAGQTYAPPQYSLPPSAQPPSPMQPLQPGSPHTPVVPQAPAAAPPPPPSGAMPPTGPPNPNAMQPNPTAPGVPTPQNSQLNATGGS